MKKIILSAFLLTLIFSFGLVLAPQVLAQTAPCPPDSPNCLQNPLNVKTPQELIGQIINSVLGIVGSLALLMFVFGGITWMTSSGNAEKVKKGRDILVWSAIGLVIIFSAYGLVRVLIENVKK
jgi:hypothetical protein